MGLKVYPSGREDSPCPKNHLLNIPSHPPRPAFFFSTNNYQDMMYTDTNRQSDNQGIIFSTKIFPKRWQGLAASETQ